MKNKGAAFITALVFSVILGISASAFVFMTSSEIGIVKRQNNSLRALYAAEAGVEKMYVYIKSKNPMPGDDDPWICGPANCSVTINDNIGGAAYSTTATTQKSSGDDIIVSSTGLAGDAGGTVIVKYKKGPKNPFEGFSSGRDIDLHGYKLWFLKRWVNVDSQPGALFANGSINANQYTNVQGTQMPNADVPMPQFLETMTVDTDGDGTPDTERYIDLDGQSPPVNPNSNDPDGKCNHFYDVDGNGDPVNAAAAADKKGPDNCRKDNNGDGNITKADNPFDPVTETDNYNSWNGEFDSDDVDSNGEITERDGFVWYYTRNLGGGKNSAGTDYDIAEGEADYYSGDTYFGPAGEHVDEDTNIVFVDGDVDMLFGGPSYYWWESNLTVVATGDVTMTMPINQEEDHLNIVSYGNVQSNSNLFNFWDGFYVNMYAHGSIDINAGDWSASRGIFGSMVANEGIDIGDLLLLNRHVNYDEWILGSGMVGKPLFPYIPAELKIGSRISWERN